MSTDFPKEEEIVLEKWREINAFQRQVSRTVFARGKLSYKEADQFCTA